MSIEKRTRLLQSGIEGKGPIVYWMSRDQRVSDNYALLFAQELAFQRNTNVVVVFSLVKSFLGATLRQYDFMLKGLQKVEKKLNEFKIPFLLFIGDPQNTIPNFLKDCDANSLVADFDPLRIKRIWKREVARSITIPFYEVDTHNIVPCLYVSDKQEFAAYTIRPKIHNLLDEFLVDIPEIKPNKFSIYAGHKNDWDKIYSSIEVDNNVKPSKYFEAGEEQAFNTFNDFLKNKFENYHLYRNDPSVEYISNISPYLHFGQISAQRVAFIVKNLFPNHPSSKVFLEELIIRKELSDNFCYFNTKYDSFEGFPDWAKETLNQHRNDKREFLYSEEEFEFSKTHDDLWNAAQSEMVITGKMHGYMRMYWAKKILEWTSSPEEALRIAIYLNDKYELDGRDPNGYVGCGWSIGGVHDRPWFEREVFGKIRYMNRSGAERKFDVKKYIEKIETLKSIN
ncbi:MAG: deoxyribodipyrimidine photo-lyase [Ignavibacterium sp.]|nr:deoxyribodipyrimidine photo-lyase [Ignavibacterium sp.]